MLPAGVAPQVIISSSLGQHLVPPVLATDRSLVLEMQPFRYPFCGKPGRGHLRNLDSRRRRSPLSRPLRQTTPGIGPIRRPRLRASRRCRRPALQAGELQELGLDVHASCMALRGQSGWIEKRLR